MSGVLADYAVKAAKGEIKSRAISYAKWKASQAAKRGVSYAVWKRRQLEKILREVPA
jgi:hypothetical protein